MPEQPNRAQFQGDADHFAEMERIVTESVGSGRPSARMPDGATAQRREAHDPRDYPRRDTSWRDPQVRTTVRAGLTPQPMPNQLADLEALLRSENPGSRSDATAPQYAGMSPPQISNIETGSHMSGQYRGKAMGNNPMPDDDVTLPMHAILKNGQPRAAAVDPRVAHQGAYNTDGHDPYAVQYPEAAYDPAGALNNAQYAHYTHEEAAFYEDEALAQGHAHDQHAAYYAPQYDDDEYDDYARQVTPPQRRSSASPLLFGGAVIAALLIVGGGGLYAYRAISHTEVGSSGGIPLIRADTKPVKELVPASQPTQASNTPNLDVARDSQDKLVTQTEDPVDKIPVKPPVRVVGTQPTTLAPVQRVHSVIVRPDGTIVSPETTASATPAPQPAPMPAPAPTPAPAPAAQVPDSLKPLPPLSPPTQIATAPVAAASAKPAQIAPIPAPPPAPQRVAKPEPAAPLSLGPTPGQQPVRTANAPQAAQASQPVAAGDGEYMVQISSSRSDSDAHHALQVAVQKYAALGVRGGDVRPADLGARGMYYRARLSGGSREQAVQLCQQIKAQGGDCMVTHR